MTSAAMDNSATLSVGKMVNTKLLMVASAAFMALLGLGASFFPEEILVYFGAPPEGFPTVLLSIVGALYIGFAMLNWMARGNIIGGVYSRPVAVGNFIHFLMVAIILVGEVTATSHTAVFVTGAVAYAIFAGCFGYLLFAKGGSCG